MFPSERKKGTNNNSILFTCLYLIWVSQSPCEKHNLNFTYKETALGKLGHSSQGRNRNLTLAFWCLMKGQIHCMMYVRSEVSSTTEGTLNIFLWLFTLIEKIIFRVFRSKVNSRVEKVSPPTLIWYLEWNIASSKSVRNC